jgi:adenylate cyclase
VQPSSELEAVVRRFLDARLARDVDAMQSLHSSSEWVRLIGSDRDEWSQGLDEAVEAWTRSQVEDDSWHVEDSSLLRIEAYENGDTGWAAVEQERTLVNGQVFIFRITMVFVLELYTWKIVQLHFSTPVADEQILGVELTETLTDLLTSIDTESGSETIADAGLGTATIVFTDVVDSTVLSQSMGDRAWSELITSHFYAAEGIVHGRGGVVVKTVGDGGMYAFRSGTSALRAAIDIQESIVASPNDQIRLRVGVHTGDVIQSHSDYLGLTVNKAARVTAAAEGGQILVSSSTADMLNDADFAFDAPIIAELKGIEGTHTLRPLHWQ